MKLSSNKIKLNFLFVIVLILVTFGSYLFIQKVYALQFIESDFNDSQTFNKYIVQTSGRDIIFYKSKISEKWWMLIDNSKNKSVSYLPCLETDYLDSVNDTIPARWLKATKRI